MSYQPLLTAGSRFVQARGLRHHIWVWGSTPRVGWPLPTASASPPLVVLHGWMDMGASFQFLVDALHQQAPASERTIIALDLRGFGSTEGPPSDTYWYSDYIADLEAVLDVAAPQGTIDLLGHSMGGNLAMLYAGIRPQRIRKLINLEGFGLPATQAQQAPGRYAGWLDQLKAPQVLQPYASAGAVADKLQKNNPRLTRERADWLAPHWARQADDGLWHLRADPAHKHINPILYQKDEAMACWARISAPMLWVEGDQTPFFGNNNPWCSGAYPRAEFDERLSVVPHVERCVLRGAGHMMHHDQPEALATALLGFLGH